MVNSEWYGKFKYPGKNLNLNSEWYGKNTLRVLVQNGTVNLKYPGSSSSE
jgi:hypothetical protein